MVDKKTYMKEWYEKNKDAQREKSRLRYQENKEVRKAYLESNKETILEKAKQYRDSNREKLREGDKRWYWENRERKLAANKEYRQTNRERLEALRIERTYGLPAEEWKALQKKQNGHCAICDRRPKILFVDHDHQTGKVRGLLCQHCNTFIGHARDDVAILQKGQVYLSQHL